MRRQATERDGTPMPRPPLQLKRQCRHGARVRLPARGDSSRAARQTAERACAAFRRASVGPGAAYGRRQSCSRPSACARAGSRKVARQGAGVVVLCAVLPRHDVPPVEGVASARYRPALSEAQQKSRPANQEKPGRATEMLERRSITVWGNAPKSRRRPRRAQSNPRGRKAECASSIVRYSSAEPALAAAGRRRAHWHNASEMPTEEPGGRRQRSAWRYNPERVASATYFAVVSKTAARQKGKRRTTAGAPPAAFGTLATAPGNGRMKHRVE